MIRLTHFTCSLNAHALLYSRAHKPNRSIVYALIVEMALMILSATLIQFLCFGTVFAISGPPMPKPNCMETCGNLTIPYPFGLGIHCSMNQAFNLSCTNTSTINPPKLLWGSHEVANISVEGEMILTTAISYYCLEQGGRQGSRSSRIVLAGNSSFTFSSAKNKFTVIGCDTMGLFTGSSGDNFASGCASYCSSDKEASDGLCDGIGCCQMAIPQGVTELDVSLQSLTNNRNLSSRLSCGYAFVVDEGMFSFRASDLRDGSFRRRTVPVVVDWSVGGVGDTCQTTEKKNRTCIDGECLNSPAGQGYRCKCRQGYEGNPYIRDGCQDVDECERKLHNCSERATCVNKSGSFHCQCPQGEEGDGRNGGNGCTKQGERSVTVAEIVIGACGSALFLLLGISRLVWKYNKAKSRTPKGKYYSRNGGHILENRAFLDQDIAKIKIFKEKELRKAINIFWCRVMHEDKEGGQRVYKGRLDANRLVAIREVDTTEKEESEIETFVNQIVELYKMGKKNMIQLVGCCFETELPLIVYEFVPRHVDANEQSLDDLIQIAEGTAKLLADPPPIAISLTTLMFFPIGFKENEVFYFGVALVELLTGKKPMSYHKFQHKRKHYDIATQCITLLEEASLLNFFRDSGSDQGTAILELARCCLKENTIERPKMEEVAFELNNIRNRNKVSEV